jgi:predicted DNA-binding transcriptional regulator AlpA
LERSDYDLLSIDEVARTVGHSVRHVRRMVADGEFPEGFPAPKALRWQWSDIKEWVMRRKLLHQLEQKSDKTGHGGTSKKAT